MVESGEREQVEPRDVRNASALIDYFKAHARRVFTELHGMGSLDLLAAALGEFLEEHGGSWEGTATELKEALSNKRVEGLPQRAEELSKQVRTIASRSRSLDVKDGWRKVDGKSQRFLRLVLRIAVDAVDAVDYQPAEGNSVYSVYSNSGEDPQKEEITRAAGRTPPLSAGEWEEI